MNAQNIKTLLFLVIAMALSGCRQADTSLSRPVADKKAEMEKVEQMKQYGVSSQIIEMTKRMVEQDSNLNKTDFDTLTADLSSRRLSAVDMTQGLSIVFSAKNLDVTQKAKAFDVAVALLKRPYPNDDGMVTGTALTVLERLGDKRAIPYIQPFIKDQSDTVRINAEAALKALSP